MLFNSYLFIFLFFPITLIGMFCLGKYSHRLAALWLVLASLTFYAEWDAHFVLLLLGSIMFNYGASYWIGLQRNAGSNRQARYALAFAIIANLLLLGYFKYANFFITSTNQLLGSDFPSLNIILPLGISFFTFTQIAFLVDVYRGIAREYNFIHYLLFITYFPHLIAGPVLHHKQMMPQFAKTSTYQFNAEHFVVGLTIFILGLSKKVLVADHLSVQATPIFNAVRDGQILTLPEAWNGALAYTLQLYFDFSGYSDMAIGLSLMLNVRLPMNFDSPYKSTSIIDFWKRWHMTLSAFLRDYLYIPLGGNRQGSARRYINLITTMLLGGLWHGAGWTFIIWGALHGLYLTLNHGWREFKLHLGWGDGGTFSRLIAGALTFIAVVVAWVFFRADNLTVAYSMLRSMFGVYGLRSDWLPIREQLKVIIPPLLIVWLLPNVREMLILYRPTWNDTIGETSFTGNFKWKPTKLTAVLMGLLFALSLIGITSSSEFLYFQF